MFGLGLHLNCGLDSGCLLKEKIKDTNWRYKVSLV